MIIYPFREKVHVQEEMIVEKPFTIQELEEFDSFFKNIDSYWPNEDSKKR